jgi:TonB family protein
VKVRDRAFALALLLVGFAAQAGDQLRVSPDARRQAEQAGNLMRECRYEEAEAIVAATLKDASPADRRFMLLTAGMLAEHRNDLPAALRHYDEAAAGEQVALEALHMLGRAQVANRQFAEGRKSLTGYINYELKRGSVPTQQDFAALAVATSEAGNPEEALKLLETLAQRDRAYDPLIFDLRALLRHALAGNAPTEANPYWRLAYGGEPRLGAAVTDFEAVPLKRTPPRYPRDALNAGKQGHVAFRVTLDEGGNVTQASVVESEPGDTFVREARNAVLKWKFKPRVRGCRPTKSEAIQTIQFRLAR